MATKSESGSLLVTGGAGFIGSALIRELIKETDTTVVNVDALSYAGNLESLAETRHDARHVFEHADIRDARAMERIFGEHRPAAIVHLAAETHVDRSIGAPETFVDTNVGGTCRLLEAARAYWNELDDGRKRAFRFLHVSTDEVYGDLGPDGPACTEDSRYAPSSPYAASKAAADHLVCAWHRTYGLPVLIAHCSNNFGPCQYPEKLVPLMILNALDGRPLPLYGTGANVRDWIYVEDNARALSRVLASGQPGRRYNVSARQERSNLEIVRTLCGILDELAPRAAGSYAELIRFVADRPGHDRRYATDNSRICSELGWQPEEGLETGLRKTVEWYLGQPQWIERARSKDYGRWIASQYADFEAER